MGKHTIKILFLVLVFLLFAAVGSYRSPVLAEDNHGEISVTFENLTDLRELHAGTQKHLAGLNLTEPDGDVIVDLRGTRAGSWSNNVTLLPTGSNSIGSSIEFRADPSDQYASSSAITMGDFSYSEGDEVWVSFDVLLHETQDAGYLFLYDMDSSTTLTSPGRRLMIAPNGALVVQSEGQRAGRTFRQDEPVVFPAGQWVELTLHMHLSSGRDGLTQLWQNGVKIIDETGRNLPGSRASYDRAAFGITANSSDVPQRLMIDNIRISNEAPIM